jgi:hypothetical protein
VISPNGWRVKDARGFKVLVGGNALSQGNADHGLPETQLKQ